MKRLKFYNPFMDRPHYTEEEAKQLRDELLKIKIVDSNNKVVQHCSTKKEAVKGIIRRKQVALLLGFSPKDYYIKNINQ